MPLSFPVGSWSGWYFSEEIRHAVTLGYKCQFKWGYSFTRTPGLFQDYVNSLYQLKTSATNPVDKAISKLLLNSLYGRWGMQLDRQNTAIGSGRDLYTTS